MDLSIIIVNWNGWQDVETCLASIRRTVKKTSYEVILIDNASKEDRCGSIRALFPDMTLTVVRNGRNEGFARACNQGLGMAGGDLLLFLNPDTQALENAVDGCVEYMKRDPHVGILGCRLLNDDRTTQLWTAGKFPSIWSAFAHYLFLCRLFPASPLFQGLYLSEKIPGPRSVDWVCGAYLMVRPEAVRAAGPMNEDYFMYAEDMEWCYRMKKAGWRVVYDPDAEIVHASGKSMARLAHARYWKGLYSISRFYRTHGGSPLSGPLFDLITSLGFLLRFFSYKLAVLAGSGGAYPKKAADSWGFFKASVAILLGRNEKQKSLFEGAVS